MVMTCMWLAPRGAFALGTLVDLVRALAYLPDTCPCSYAGRLLVVSAGHSLAEATRIDFRICILLTGQRPLPLGGELSRELTRMMRRA
jgi:hypothetical protein